MPKAGDIQAEPAATLSVTVKLPHRKVEQICISAPADERVLTALLMAATLIGSQLVAEGLASPDWVDARCAEFTEHARRAARHGPDLSVKVSDSHGTRH